MEVCQLINYGVPAWGPSKKTKGLLATGTNSSLKDADSYLRISQYQINHQDGHTLQGITQSPAKFSSLDWVDFNDQYGIIAGGMEDGAITLWDPKKILDGQSTLENLKMGKGCVSATKIHNGISVGSIEFNPHKKNLLASGGSEVLIQDISGNLKAPNVFKPGVPNYHEGSRITSISWNRQVPHILASASENGKIVVWDLKVNKSIFNFTEPSSSVNVDDYFGSQIQNQTTQQAKEMQMMWNPEIPTQFVVANDDDQNPVINIWDLRNPSYPVATFNDIHYGGILSFSWSLQDTSLVVSTGKDNRTVVTNFKTGEKVLEFPTQSQFKKIRWSNNFPGKICALNNEGSSSILSFEPEGLLTNPGKVYASPQVSQTTNEIYVPKWNMQKGGASFGYGNKLISFNNEQKGIVYIQHRSINTDLIQRVQEFDNLLDQRPMNQICDIKSQNSQNDHDMMEFKVLKCLIENDYDDLLKQFGIDKNKAAFEAERYLGRKFQKPAENKQQVQAKPIQNTLIQSSLPQISAGDAADFFSQLGQKDQTQNQAQEKTSDVLKEGASGGLNQMPPSAGNSGEYDQRAPNHKQQFVQETISRNTNWDEGAEGIIKQNLLIGELEHAALVALKCGRTAEAFLIAEAGGQDLFKQIKDEYFQQHKDPFVREIISAVTKNDFSQIISSAQNNLTRQIVSHVPQTDNLQAAQIGDQVSTCNWKQLLAYVIAYHDKEKLKEVAKSLGDQLLQSKTDINSAIVCYILSRQVDIVTDLWKKRALYQIRKLGFNKYEALFILFQKTLILRSACADDLNENQDIDLILTDFAEFLNAEKQPFLAMKYLQNVSKNSLPIVKDTIHRIYNSSLEIQQVFPKPHPSYIVEQVKPQQLNNQVNLKTQAVQRSQLPQQQIQAQQIHLIRQPQQNTLQNNFKQPMPVGNKQIQNQVPNQIPQQQMAQLNLQNVQKIEQQQVSQKIVVPDESLHANYGYGNQTKQSIVQNQQPQIQNQLQQSPKKQNIPQQPSGVGQTPVRRPGPTTPGQIGNQPPPAMQGLKTVPLPALKPQMPNNQTASQNFGTQQLSAFNPAEAQNQRQISQNQNQMQTQNQAQQKPVHQVIRPPPMKQPVVVPSAPISQPQAIQLVNPTPIQTIQPPPMHNPMSQKIPQNAPPIMKQPQKFAAPPMGIQNPPNQAQNIQPPPLAPPMGAGGPRPMTSGLAPPRQNAVQIQAPQSSSIDPQGLVNGYQAIFSQYCQIETNQKLLSETETKLSIMVDKINANQLLAVTIEKLNTLMILVQEDNPAGAQQVFREITQKCWNDVKDFSNALKALASYKQKYSN